MSYEVEDQSHLPTLPGRAGIRGSSRYTQPRAGSASRSRPVSGSGCLACVDSTRRPGVNGHTARSGNLAKVNDQNAGFLILDDPRLVAKYRKVLRAQPGPAGSRAYWLAWDTPLVSGRSVARKRDAAQALEFRRWLVSSGTVELPDPVHLDSTIDTMRKQVARATRRAGNNPHLVGKLDEDKRTLAAARAAAKAPDGRWTETPPEAAKPRRRSTKKEVQA